MIKTLSAAIILFLAAPREFTAVAQTSNLNAVEMVTSGTGYIAGTGGSILKTTDGGLNWTRLGSSTSSTLFDVTFSDNSTGTVVGGDALTGGSVISRTSNGGTSWTNQPSGVSSTLTGVAFPTSSLGVAVGNNGIILRTSDGGSAWTPVPSGTTENLKKVFFVNTTTGFVAGWNGTIMRTDDGGLTWTRQTVASTTIFYDVHFTDLNTGTVVGYQGAIFRTTDGGSSWHQQTSGTIESLYGVFFSGPSTGTIVGSTGLILRTTDGGANWVRQSGGTYQNLNGVAFTGATTGIIAGSGETILRTTDGGASWSIRPVDGSAVTPPAAPALSSPSNGSAGHGATVTCAWYGSTGATSYHLQVSTSSTFSSVVKEYPNLGGTSQDVPGLNDNTTYYWRVGAANSGGTSAWSSVWSFSTAAAPPSVPDAPVLASPLNGSADLPTSPSLSWQSSNGAVTYHLQVATRGNFKNNVMVFDDASIGTTSKTVGGLNTNSTYYWRVSASNSLGTSGWSEIRTFSTGTVVAAPSVTTDPASSVLSGGGTLNGRVNPNGGSTGAWFEWGTSSTLSAYSQTATQSVGSGTSALAVSAVLNGLSENTVYYFRAAAQNGSGTIRGDIRSFTTAPAPTGPVFALDQPSLDFGTVQVGSSSTLTVTLSNPGISTLVVSSIVSGSTLFTVAPASASIAPGGSQSVDVTFTPTAKATESGSITFTHNAPGSPDALAVTGRGNTKGRPRPGSKTIRYANSFTTDAPEVSFPLYNDGNEDIRVSSIAVTSDAFTADISDVVIYPGDNRTVTVSFDPGSDAPATGYVVLTYADLVVVDSVFVDFGAAVGRWDGPVEFGLAQNYPNPFNPATTIGFTLASGSRVRLSVYDAGGAEVAVLLDGIVNTGYNTVDWDASAMPSGVYFYRLEADGFTSVKSMLLMK